jgi:hypothetical protein
MMKLLDGPRHISEDNIKIEFKAGVFNLSDSAGRVEYLNEDRGPLNYTRNAVHLILYIKPYKVNKLCFKSVGRSRVHD